MYPLSACAIPYSALPELLNPPQDKPPYRVSISNDSELKGGRTVEEAAARVRTILDHVSWISRDYQSIDTLEFFPVE